MKHFSHPHDLHVTELLRENPQKICFGCRLPLFGSCYSCSICSFYLHKYCFDLPKATKHKSHPKHTLALLYPPHTNGTCDACGETCNNAFTFNCSSCNFNIHANCARMHETARCEDDDEQRYFFALMMQKLSEQKRFKAELESIKRSSQAVTQKVEEESIHKMQKEMEALQVKEYEMYLQRKRHELTMQQIKSASDSIDFLGQIGTSSYRVEYKYF